IDRPGDILPCRVVPRDILLCRAVPRDIRDQALLASLVELRLPPTNRLLRNLLPSCGLGGRDLTGEHAQHDPQLLLSRDHRWSTHRGLVSLPCSEDQLTPLPRSLTRDRPPQPAYRRPPRRLRRRPRPP